MGETFSEFLVLSISSLKKIFLFFVFILATAAMDWPQSWSAYVGKTVTLYGKAINNKNGAMFICVGAAFCPAIYIEGFDSWPDGFYLGGDEGKHMQVTGTVIERNTGHRFLLKDAKWVVEK